MRRLSGVCVRRVVSSLILFYVPCVLCAGYDIGKVQAPYNRLVTDTVFYNHSLTRFNATELPRLGDNMVPHTVFSYTSSISRSAVINAGLVPSLQGVQLIMGPTYALWDTLFAKFELQALILRPRKHLISSGRPNSAG